MKISSFLKIWSDFCVLCTYIFHNNFDKKTLCRWSLKSYSRSGYYSK